MQKYNKNEAFLGKKKYFWETFRLFLQTFPITPVGGGSHLDEIPKNINLILESNESFLIKLFWNEITIAAIQKNNPFWISN
jgi:hypothetical protein